MGMHFHSWAEEGFYEYDDFCGYTKVTDPDRIERLKQEGKLYRSDGGGYDSPSLVPNDDNGDWGVAKTK